VRCPTHCDLDLNLARGLLKFDWFFDYSAGKWVTPALCLRSSIGTGADTAIAAPQFRVSMARPIGIVPSLVAICTVGYIWLVVLAMIVVARVWLVVLAMIVVARVWLVVLAMIVARVRLVVLGMIIACVRLVT
jgi:hypothetical protein